MVCSHVVEALLVRLAVVHLLEQLPVHICDTHPFVVLHLVEQLAELSVALLEVGVGCSRTVEDNELQSSLMRREQLHV